ncbi:oligopeptidase F. Metallo peptidase. MEROPS family M03B [Caldanaerobius fijiensis DSM 17918]|uniref:Oligopeptidase F n=1 Tax=Caldanaerobius fijiensis DSM 17918 TaxID=1121256 RepID=A0A1M4ZGP4_9THEO|nr:oligoendopeptidase F [Caldanaerobius fijiensis]SHF17213.1 oligopeptidase F. Metallo peptidase. MEROPS family M03B [Caldanaerobius fijiensis DSM 17918]
MKRLPTREEIDAKYKWQLEDIYATDELWESDFKKLKAMLPDIQKYKGKIDSAQAVYDVLKLKDDISMIAEKLFTYARMRRDENNDNTVYQALADRAMAMIAEVQSELSFVVPELLSKPTEVLYKYIEEKEELKLYKRYIDELIRQKDHILSAEEERLLAMAGEVTEAPDTIFTMINDADIRFPVIKDETGEDIELTKGRYIQLLKSHDRRVRKDAYEALYDTYGKLKNTLATTYSYSVKKDIFYARVRKYNSSLEASLDDDNVPVSVYDGLIDAVNSNLGLLHRYMSLRKKILKLDQLAMYDVYVPLVKDVKKEIPYEEATNIVKNGLTPLGSEYIGLLEKGFNSKWIDVFENQGKTSGAYSWGCYGVHPYVLLNYQGALDDVFTLAHEMGHALHTYYSNSSQPYIYANYRIFVAEVASTLNEALLIHYLLEKTSDKNEKLYLINHYLEEFRGTVFRQTMFAEFEKIVHEKAESGIPLTPDLLCSIYKDLNARYFGPDVITDDRIALEWARIPHFYRSFYVYKYATSFSAAIAISQHILQEGKPAVDRYIEFLKSGSTDYPIELLKKAGVDMTTPQPVHDALKVFGELVDKMEQIEI